ncbi:YhdT family protein [Succinatimonas hippei]|uniref:YhdT family protein n=1 Tax=Succinatimonas hippei TaxID=626938 RepID=UPI00248FC04B|nr:YhdT family protein [Succinatimonas hippei]
MTKMTQDKLKQTFRQMDKEALSTLITAAIITVYFWLTILIFKDDISLTLFSMPLWFVLSCIGGYLLSIVAVIILVRKFMKNFSLTDFDDERKQH